MNGSTKLFRRMALLLPLAAAACGGNEPPREMPPLRYDYLTSLPLNVATVDIGDAPPPGPLEAQSPAPLGATLRQMALDRLLAGGTAGRAGPCSSSTRRMSTTFPRVCRASLPYTWT